MLGADMKGTPYCHLEDKFLTTLKCQPHTELLTEDTALHSPHHWPVPDCLCPGPPWSSLEGRAGAAAGPKLRLLWGKVAFLYLNTARHWGMWRRQCQAPPWNDSRSWCGLSRVTMFQDRADQWPMDHGDWLLEVKTQHGRHLWAVVEGLGWEPLRC